MPRLLLILLLFTCTLPACARSKLQLSPETARFSFVVDAVGWPKTKGTFNVFSGNLSVDFDRPDASHVTFQVTTRSINVGSPSFSDYLRSDAFFNVVKYPEMNFVSTEVQKVNERTARVTGDLTLLGVTHPITMEVDVTKPGSGNKVAFTARGFLNRLAFGMNTGFPVISNRVDFTVSTELREAE